MAVHSFLQIRFAVRARQMHTVLFRDGVVHLPLPGEARLTSRTADRRALNDIPAYFARRKLGRVYISVGGLRRQRGHKSLEIAGGYVL